MVEVNDKVFVAPLYGQKDNIAVITGPSGAGAVLNEGDYNTWTLEWCKNLHHPVSGSDLPDDLSGTKIDFFIDDKNNTIHMNWEDTNSKYRYGIFSCADFSNLMVTPGTWSPSDPHQYGYLNTKNSYFLGACYYSGGFSHSIQTYVLYSSYDAAHSYKVTYLNVYRNASSLWNRTVWDDLPAPQNTNAGIWSMGISLTGKYIIALTSYFSAGWYHNLLLYKGSYVE